MLLDVSYSRISGTLPSKGLLWIGLLYLTISLSHADDNVNCCSAGSVLLSSMNCSDGLKIRLACSSGSYVIDPDAVATDNFTVIQEYGKPWLQFTETEYEKIPENRFCVAERKNGSQIALICFEPEYFSTPAIFGGILLPILGIISAIFLIATLAAYVLLPELREVQDKVMMAVVTSLAVSYIVLSIQNLRPHNDGDYTICISLGFILYFGFMSVFFWLNIVSFNIWRMVWFDRFAIKEKALFLIYCGIGWGGPIFFLIVIIITHHLDGNHLKPGFGEQTCWFSGPKQMWAYFYGPIAVLLMLNIIYLGLTGWRLWHQYRDNNKLRGNKLRALRFKCLLYVKLIFVMGITWIFEVLSFIDLSRNHFWIVTDILNALQGFIIFLLLVARRKRVRKLLAMKRPCGIAFPKSWAAVDDEEAEEVLSEECEESEEPEEVELSQNDISP